MMELRELVSRVEASTSLEELRENLIALERGIAAKIEAGEVAADTRTDDFVDVRNVPTFGGAEPVELKMPVSWDAKNVLNFAADESYTGLVIEPRTE